MGEGADEENELPALVFGHAIFERGHRPFALADLVEDFAVRHGAHALGVGEIGGKRRMRPGLGAVAFTMIAVTLGAIVPVKLSGSLQGGFGARDRILAALGFFRDDPSFVLLVRGVREQDADEREDQNEKNFAHPKVALGVGIHGAKENIRITAGATKGWV